MVPACNAENLPVVQEIWVRSLGQVDPGEGDSYPLQYSYLRNPMDKGAWWAAVPGVVNSWTQLRNYHIQHVSVLHSFLGLNDIPLCGHFVCFQLIDTCVVPLFSCYE